MTFNAERGTEKEFPCSIIFKWAAERQDLVFKLNRSRRKGILHISYGLLLKKKKQVRISFDTPVGVGLLHPNKK